MKTLHVITGLNQGGAERQLANLVSELSDESVIFSLKKPGVMAKEIRKSGVPIYHGGVERSISPAWVLALKSVIREVRPDIVMGWMYHGNLAASLTKYLGHHGPVVWNVRHSIHDLKFEKASTRWVIRAGARLAKSPSSIIYNSLTAAIQHEQLGYPAGKRVIMPNGFDLARFKPDQNARNVWRDKLNIRSDEFLLGVVGRSHPMKNHFGWLKAFRMLIDKGLRVHCVMVGTGVAEADGPLVSVVRDLSLTSKVTLLSPNDSLEFLYPAFDLLVMPSLWGEGFPNVVGEAMACGVPAMVTNVGDAAAVVGNTGFVAESGTPDAMAECAGLAIARDKCELAVLGDDARERMVECYGLESVGDRYRSLMLELINQSVREK